VLKIKCVYTNVIMKRTVTLYDFFAAKRQKGRLTTSSCLTVMHVIVGLACLLQFIKQKAIVCFLVGKECINGKKD